MTSDTPYPVTHCRIGRIFSGADIYIITLSKMLERYGHPVQILLPSDVSYKDKLRTVSTPYKCILRHGDINPYNIFIIAKMLQQQNAAILNVHDRAGLGNILPGARIMRVPVIATLHHHCYSPAYKLVDHMIAVSDHVRQYCIDQGLHPKKITTVRNGIDVDAFCPGDRYEYRAKLQLQEELFYFISTSRLDRTKGHKQLFYAFQRVVERVPNSRLIVVGTGTLEHELHQLAEELQLQSHITFTGFCPDVRPWLLAADCHVLPSQIESLGLTILEAMACARPVISTNCGGPAEVIVDGETGMLVSVDDVEAMGTAMLHAATTSSWVQESGLAGREHVLQHHSLTRQVDGVRHVYQTVM